MKKTIFVHVDTRYGIPKSPSTYRLPLSKASLPTLDLLASQGECGRLGLQNNDRPFTGAFALMALLGCDPYKWYTGPGAFEGANLEVVLGKHDVAFLCDLVTLRAQEGWGDEKKLGPQLIMDDPESGGIEQEEAREFLDAINDQLVLENIQIYCGRGHRHLLVWAGGEGKIVCRNPCEAVGQSIDTYLPVGDGSHILRELMEASRVILRHHEANRDRLEEGKKPANCLWLWGPGRTMEWPNLVERWSLQGLVFSSDGPYRGVALALGLQPYEVAQGEEDEGEWLQKLATTACQAIQKKDFVCLHIPLPHQSKEEGDKGNDEGLVQSLERIDTHVIEAIKKAGAGIPDGLQLMVCCTSMPLEKDGGQGGWAPYLFYTTGEEHAHENAVHFTEEDMTERPFRDASKFLERLIAKQ